MHDLARLPSPAATTLAWQAARIAGEPVEGFAILHIKAALARADALAIALHLPAPCYTKVDDDLALVGIGPTEWLALAPAGSPALPDLAKAIEAAGGASARAEDRLLLVDVALREENAARLSGLPLSALEPGRAAKTRFAALPVLILALGDGRFRLVAERVYAAYLHRWLDRAI